MAIKSGVYVTTDNFVYKFSIGVSDIKNPFTKRPEDTQTLNLQIVFQDNDNTNITKKRIFSLLDNKSVLKLKRTRSLWEYLILMKSNDYAYKYSNVTELENLVNNLDKLGINDMPVYETVVDYIKENCTVNYRLVHINSGGGYTNRHYEVQVYNNANLDTYNFNIYLSVTSKDDVKEIVSLQTKKFEQNIRITLHNKQVKIVSVECDTPFDLETWDYITNKIREDVELLLKY